MPEPTSAVQTTELIEIVQRLIVLRSRFKVGLPDEMVDFKARLDEVRAKGKADSLADRHLLFTVGVILARQGEAVSMGELSRVLDVPLSTATRIVDWLVTNGYAERQPDPDDRRIVRVALTASGHAMYQAGTSFIRKRTEKLLRHFTPEERDCLVVLLRKLAGVMEEEL